MFVWTVVILSQSMEREESDVYRLNIESSIDHCMYWKRGILQSEGSPNASHNFMSSSASHSANKN